jgi:hypothetical protein
MQTESAVPPYLVDRDPDDETDAEEPDALELAA